MAPDEVADLRIFWVNGNSGVADHRLGPGRTNHEICRGIIWVIDDIGQGIADRIHEAASFPVELLVELGSVERNNLAILASLSAGPFKRARMVPCLDLKVGNCRLENGVPIDEALVLVDQARPIKIE